MRSFKQGNGWFFIMQGLLGPAADGHSGPLKQDKWTLPFFFLAAFLQIWCFFAASLYFGRTSPLSSDLSVSLSFSPPLPTLQCVSLMCNADPLYLKERTVWGRGRMEGLHISPPPPPHTHKSQSAVFKVNIFTAPLISRTSAMPCSRKLIATSSNIHLPSCHPHPPHRSVSQCVWHPPPPTDSLSFSAVSLPLTLLTFHIIRKLPHPSASMCSWWNSSSSHTCLSCMGLTSHVVKATVGSYLFFLGLG